MLNQIIIEGRLTHNPEIKELEDGKKETIITVAVPRAYKNVDGTYDTDFIDCKLWNGIAETTTEYCRKGDIVGIKGRIQTITNEDENGNKTKETIVVAEKVSFLSSGKHNEQNESEE